MVSKKFPPNLFCDINRKIEQNKKIEFYFERFSIFVCGKNLILFASDISLQALA